MSVESGLLQLQVSGDGCSANSNCGSNRSGNGGRLMMWMRMWRMRGRMLVLVMMVIIEGRGSRSGWMRRCGVVMWPPPSPGSGVRPNCRDIVGVVQSARQRDGWGLRKGCNIYGYFDPRFSNFSRSAQSVPVGLIKSNQINRFKSAQISVRLSMFNGTISYVI